MDARDIAERNVRQARTLHPAMRRVERRVIGCDHGATSYTTLAQADQITALLELSRGSRFLDIGSGTGWPGIYIATSAGASVVLTDIPDEGLRIAARRLARSDTDGHVVRASGTALPFATGAFDAVTSSDVLC